MTTKVSKGSPEDYILSLSHHGKVATVAISWEGIGDDNDKLWGTILRNLVRALHQKEPSPNKRSTE